MDSIHTKITTKLLQIYIKKKSFYYQFMRCVSFRGNTYKTFMYHTNRHRFSLLKRYSSFIRYNITTSLLPIHTFPKQLVCLPVHSAILFFFFLTSFSYFSLFSAYYHYFLINTLIIFMCMPCLYY